MLLLLVVVVVVDHLSKYTGRVGYYIGSSVFLHGVVRLHGFSRSIVLDRVKAFSVSFGLSFSISKVLIFVVIRHTTHRLMGR